MDNYLDYGALGLLAFALGAIGLWLRGYLNRVQESQDEREKAARTDRKELTDSFQDLVKADVEARHALTTTLEDLCAEVKACSGMGDVIEKLAKRIDANERRAEARHEQAMRQSAERHGEILAQLKALNGKS